jgi:hypothetical protein
MLHNHGQQCFTITREVHTLFHNSLRRGQPNLLLKDSLFSYRLVGIFFTKLDNSIWRILQPAGGGVHCMRTRRKDGRYIPLGRFLRRCHGTWKELLVDENSSQQASGCSLCWMVGWASSKWSIAFSRLTRSWHHHRGNSICAAWGTSPSWEQSEGVLFEQDWFCISPKKKSWTTVFYIVFCAALTDYKIDTHKRQVRLFDA